MKQAATSRSARRRNFLGFGGSKKSSSAGMGGARRDAYNRGFSGQSEVAFDKWLARQSYTKHSLLHHSSVSVKDLRRAYQDGQRDLFEKKRLVEREKLDKYKRRQEERAEAAKEREKIRREKAEERAQARHELAAEREKIRQQKAELAELRAHKRDEKAPPIPEGEKASDQNLEYKGHLIKRTTTGWEVLGESGWGSLKDAKAYVDVYEATGGRVRRKNPSQPNKYQAVAVPYLERVRAKYPDIEIIEKRKPMWTAGMYSDGRRFLKIPNPTTPGKLYTVLHECGHVLLDHNGKRTTPNLAEYEAEHFAMEAMAKADIPIPETKLKFIRYDMQTTILDDMWENKPIDSRALRMAGGEDALKSRKEYKAVSTELAERKAGVPESKRTYRQVTRAEK